MNVLVIDNIDSFVYNIVQYVGMLGTEPVVVQNTVTAGYIAKLVEEQEIEHIIISPGPKTPREAGVTNEVIRRYYTTKKILGVCLGHQCIGYVFGAEIRNAHVLRHGKVSLVAHNGEGVLNGLRNPLSVVRYHSLVIDDNGRESFSNSLEVTARSLDDNEIMAVRHRDYDVFGVQFHPESILTEDGLKLLKNFVDL
ncbi:MAG: Anthranilate synthase component 2 [Candidatus Methanophagaceae archaeon]|nr:MAG: Anthranilate synthase component 2 [Methanophagales archaeon]KAF5431459.1 anthranilate synthase component 2 [Methanophagales archaeon]